MIKYWFIEDELRKTHRLTPIKIKTNVGIKRVFLTKVQNKIWARAQHDVQDILIYPTKQITILSIGSREVQSYQASLEEKKEYYSIIKQLARERRRRDKLLICKEAKRRALLDQNVNI